MRFKQLVSSIFCVVLLFGFYACEKTSNVYELTTLAVSKDLASTNTDTKLKNDKTLVAIILTDDASKTKYQLSSFQNYLNKQTLNAEILNKEKGELTFLEIDKRNGFSEVQNFKQPTLTLADLNIDVEATSYSHLTTYRNTDLEIITYQPDAALSRAIDRGVGVIIVTATGRYPDSLSF